MTDKLISAKELKDRLIKYREDAADNKSITPKEYSVLSATLMAVFAIIADLNTPKK